jgi:D-alanyl-lipoteichoic acid acyltransferase DltB (MBOAT superfamily)
VNLELGLAAPSFVRICDVEYLAVMENFRSPLGARNIKEYWSRWHISLSDYVRTILFAPVSAALARRWGERHVNRAIAVALFLTFFATGVWHGAGLNFALFGFLHGSAMVVHHYYTLLLRRKLTREQLRSYNGNSLVRAVAVAATFTFVTAALVVFANDLSALRALPRVNAGGIEELLLPR